MDEIRVAENKDHFYLFLAIDIFDRYTARTEYSPDSTKLMALIALFISSELTYRNREIEKYILHSEKLGKSRNEFINSLCEMEKTLDWNLFRPTIYLNNPQLNPQKVFQCYLDNVNVSLETCLI